MVKVDMEAREVVVVGVCRAVPVAVDGARVASWDARNGSTEEGFTSLDRVVAGYDESEAACAPLVSAKGLVGLGSRPASPVGLWPARVDSSSVGGCFGTCLVVVVAMLIDEHLSEGL